MKLFRSNKKPKRYLVLADGSATASVVAALLSAEGESVLTVSARQEDLEQLTSRYDGYAMLGDVTDPDVLEKAQVAQAYTLIVATDDDNKNMMLAQLAKEIYGVDHVIALINDSTRQSVYRSFGIPSYNPKLLPPREIIRQIIEPERAYSV